MIMPVWLTYLIPICLALLVGAWFQRRYDLAERKIDAEIADALAGDARERAYAAVRASGVVSLDPAMVYSNARVWRGVQAALDATEHEKSNL